ncbi:MAG: UDP-N-acetylmuramate dehydrogenase [Bacillota bacterium]|nr:UDP-N-acetylmuramate dehydrogenase [Bacillota bacterium]
MISLALRSNDIKQDLTAVMGQARSRLHFDEPMSRHTSFRIGGSADVFFEPADTDEIDQAVRYCRSHDLPCTIIGNGSNILVADQGIRGMVLVIGEHFSGIESQEGIIDVKAGTRLSALAAGAAQMQYTGLEFASGIPGTLGGAIQMNAGAYDSCMQDIVIQTEFIDEQLNYRTCTGAEHQFDYRHSAFSGRDVIIVRSRLQLREGDRTQIIARMAELAERRRQSQPLELPSAGSAFKRPTGYFAGKLISDCRLKGTRIGDAQVSEKHAGFIVNLGQATACDVRRLMEHVQDTVLAHTGVQLDPEIKFIGDWQN